MKVFCVTFLLVVLFEISNGNNDVLVRTKRFFDSLWPSEVKSDVQNGLIYSQLPAEYLYLLPGVNDHKMIQSRADGQQPLRYVHPTRMAILPVPRQHAISVVQHPGNIESKTSIANPNTQPSTQHKTKIIMKPAMKTNPSITLKTKQQLLPDIHKNQRFLPLKPVHSVSQHFNIQQQLPIKKAFDIASPPQHSIKTAGLDDFYFTQEFQNLLKNFNIKVDIKKLPPISDVMIVLGTETAEETINAINEVAQSPEGMELIKTYLDHNTEKDNDDESEGYAGEIQVQSGSDSVESFDVSHSNQGVRQNSYILKHSSLNNPTSTTTTGTLTGQVNRSPNTWWRPNTWFSSGQSTRVESLQKDVEILKKMIPAPGSPTQNLDYIRNFFTPASRHSIPIELIGNPTRSAVKEPARFIHSSIFEETNMLPAVRMTETQFQDMVKALRLTPMNVQHTQKLQSPSHSAVTRAPKKFLSPINVQSVSSGLSQQSLPLPSTYTKFEQSGTRDPQPILVSKISEQENRRSFVSASDPQRAAPYDFIAAGRIHQANPDEVLKKSRSLVEAADGVTL